MAACGISPQWSRFVSEKAFWYDPPQSELTHRQHGQWTFNTWADSPAPLSSMEEAFLSPLLHFGWKQFKGSEGQKDTSPLLQSHGKSILLAQTCGSWYLQGFIVIFQHYWPVSLEGAEISPPWGLSGDVWSGRRVPMGSGVACETWPCSEHRHMPDHKAPSAPGGFHC